MDMTITFPGGARVDAEVGPSRFVRTSRPRRRRSSAPAPFTLFLASIGTCAGIYVLGFCKQRGSRGRHPHRPADGAGPAHRARGKIGLDIEVPVDFPASTTMRSSARRTSAR